MKNQKNQGVVILFAILIIGLLIGIGVAVNTLTDKQLILSSVGKQSQVAFYAADTGAEYAEYEDKIKHAFDGTHTKLVDDLDRTNSDGTIDVIPTQDQTKKYHFSVNVFAQRINGQDIYYCADVTVTTNDPTYGTVIDSSGFNVPCGTQDSARKVERTIELSY